MKQRTRICPYNDWIICTEQSIAKCRKCGWNPREQRRRKAYDPPPEIDEEVAKAFFEAREIQRWRDGTFGKTEEAKKVRIEFTIPGEAVGKARPRVCGGHAFTPEKTRLYEAQVGWEFARAAKKRGATGFLRPPLAVFIYAFHETPKSWSKKKRAEAMGMPWTGLPDADNICKAILDGLQGVAFENDSAVTDVTVVKRYTDEADGKAHVRVIIHDGEDIFA